MAKFAKTFYLASVFLPERKRNACYVVYPFCRYLDGLVDENIAHGGGAILTGYMPARQSQRP